MKTYDLDFENLVQENKKYYDVLWDYCCCIGKEPSDVIYPGMVSHVARHTFNMVVYESARPDQVKREAEMAGMGAISKVMG